MKTFDVVNSVDTLKKISGLDIPFPTAIKLKRILKDVDEVLQTFDEKRKELLEKYSEEVEGSETPNQVRIKDDCIEDYNREITDILDTDLDLDIKPLKATDFENATATISANEMMAVDWLFED